MFRWRLLVFAVLGTTLFLMAVKKAATAAITWDEAFTFFEFIKTGELYPGAGGGMAANNHLLNTWMSYLFTSILGTNELTLRLGNLLFYAFYLAATVWMALHTKSFTASFTVFAALNFNPYLFDFFCLSRGYGIAHSCLLLNIIFIYRYYQTGYSVWLKRMILSAMAGMLAGAMLLPAFSLLYGAVFFLMPMTGENTEKSNMSWKHRITSSLNRIPLNYHIIFVLSVAVGAAYLILLQKFNAFLFGGHNGIFSNMILSVISNSGYNSEYKWLMYAAGISVFIISMLLMLVTLRKSKKHYPSAEDKTVLTLIFTIVAIFLTSGMMHYLFSTPIPSERTALYLYLLFALTISLSLIRNENQHCVIKPACLIAGLLLTMHFVSCYNFKTFRDWQPDADAPLMINDLKNADFIDKKMAWPTIASLELEMPLKFYIEKSDELKSKISISRISDQPGKADICFLDRTDFELYGHLLLDKQWQKISYPQGGHLLYRIVSEQ